MKFMILSLLLVSYQALAVAITESSSKICLFVPAYADLIMPESIEFESISQNEKGAAKHLRASHQLQLEANVPVQVIASSPTLTNGLASYTPNVLINQKKDQAYLAYMPGSQTIDLRMDMNLPANEIQKAGDYTGALNIVVMADLDVQGCH